MIYQYRCDSVTCNHIHDEIHAMGDVPRVECPICGCSCHKILTGSVATVYNGGGFHKTDYRGR